MRFHRVPCDWMVVVWGLCLVSSSVPVLTAVWELCDLIADPSETRNLAEQRPQILEKMKKTLEQWQASCAAGLRG